MSKNVMKELFEDLKETGYDPFWKNKSAEAANRRFTWQNRKANFRISRRAASVNQTVNSTADPRAAFLQALKNNADLTRTENGGLTYRSTGSEVLDLFAGIGALRHMRETEILTRFYRAWAEDREKAMKILFYARDVRGGLGERRVFRSILWMLSELEPENVRKNIALIPFYGRHDDLLELLGTPCEADALDYIRNELAKDMAALAAGEPVSLLAKWLPSVNASSEETRRQAVKVARGIGMSDSQYRRTLSALRSAEQILENKLREKDYSFDYAKQPSKAMLKYRKAFFRYDEDRYQEFLDKVEKGEATLHTKTLMPYELVRKALVYGISEKDRRALDVTWNALEDFTDGRNTLAVIDGSASMYWTGDPKPAEVALSLGMYYAERNTGLFKDHFISFSMNPQLVEIKGTDFVDRVRYCKTFNECANTNIQAVFELILDTAVRNKLPQSELPETLYIISDMEFDSCTANADMTNFEYAKRIFEHNGYRLPDIVFWNVQSRNQQFPVKMNEQGVALVSGASARIFSLVMKDDLEALDPYTLMMKVIGSERYAPVHA